MVNDDHEGSISIPNSAVNNQTTLICIAKNVHPPEVSSSEVVLHLIDTQESTTDLTTSDSALENSNSTTATLSSAAALTRLNSVILSFIIALCVIILL